MVTIFDSKCEFDPQTKRSVDCNLRQVVWLAHKLLVPGRRWNTFICTLKHYLLPMPSPNRYFVHSSCW